MSDQPWRKRACDNVTMARPAMRKVQHLAAKGYIITVESGRGVSEALKRARRYEEDIIAPTDEI